MYCMYGIKFTVKNTVFYNNIRIFESPMGGIEQELLFWCLLVCCIDRQVREEGGSQEKREGFLLRS